MKILFWNITSCGTLHHTREVIVTGATNSVSTVRKHRDECGCCSNFLKVALERKMPPKHVVFYFIFFLELQTFYVNYIKVYF